MPNNLNIITINNNRQCSELIRNYFINTYQAISTKERVGTVLLLVVCEADLEIVMLFVSINVESKMLNIG